MNTKISFLAYSQEFETNPRDQTFMAKDLFLRFCAVTVNPAGILLHQQNMLFSFHFHTSHFKNYTVSL